MSAFGGAPVALAKFDSSSAASVNAAYDLFKTNPTNTTEFGSTTVSAQPLSISNNSTVLQCSIPASQEHFTDLSESFVSIDVKFTKKDKSDLPAANHADLKSWPETFLAHSMFSRVGLTLNDTEVYHSSQYPPMAYIDALLNESVDAKRGRMTASGWFEDSLTGKEATQVTAAAASRDLARKKLVGGSRVLSLVFNPLTPFRDSDKRIPTGVSLKLTTTRADIKTFIISTEQDPDIVMEILRFEWVVRRCIVNPAVTRAFNSRLLEGAKYSLPFPRQRCKSWVVPTGVQTHRINLAEQNYLPQLLAITLVDQEAANGSFGKSQFNFKPYGVSSYDVLLDGVLMGRSLKCDYANGNAAEAYSQTVSAIGQTSSRSGNGISYNDFLSNKAVIVFALNEPKNEEWRDYFHIKRKATLELVITFAAATTQALTLLVSDLREDNLSIDMEGRVHMTEPAV